ncbi:tigger transposable element-derived protein 4-like [Bactrocera neohumeralis]|uniref:tigger transposable element-derived protein 4-like n=1 Tax=Bactrocera neohumeralis TaxID=98809 RepID=UPI002166A7C4|nr:tigger transposable element-derived protein 4-like [Bactrocera neohumeralis]
MLMMKANEFGEAVGANFKCSSGWLDRFKKRHNICFGKICGESASVDQSVTNDWLLQTWPTISNNYSMDNIFNADETGIFYKMLPDKTHKMKGETCSGGKMSKERITAMICANASGTVKRKLLVIGKYNNPRCFKNVKTLPVDYCANNKSWMTSQTFTDYLKKWDCELIKAKTKILLLVDNCPAHPQVHLHNIKLHFLPPNTTSVLQPMDQGLINSLKQSYRKQHLMKIMDLPEEANPTKAVNLLDAVNMLSVAWESVSKETIRNCFRHAGLVKDIPDGLDFDP